MIEESVEIYELLLMRIIDCPKETLHRLIKLLVNAQKMVGTDTFNKILYCIGDHIREGMLDIPKDVIYYTVSFSLAKILKVDELSDLYLSEFLGMDFNNPNFQFSAKDFEKFEIDDDLKSSIIEKFNKFLK